jgi:hypothetical protein
MFLLGSLMVFETSAGGLDDEVLPGQALRYHLIDLPPVRNATDITVVNPHVGLDFAREMVVPLNFLLGVVLVDRIKLYSSLETPVDGVFEKLTFTYAPED